MTTYSEQASYLQEVAELKKMFPDIDFVDEWILVDVQGWSDYEEGATYWLLEHKPTDKLYQLDDISSVMAGYRTPRWSDLFETTMEQWFVLINEIDEANKRRELS